MGGSNAARRVVKRLTPKLVRVGVVVVLHTTSRPSRPMYTYFAVGEKTRASRGRCVFKNRRWIMASTIGSLTSFGGTRRSSHGDISATARFGSGPNSRRDDLLHPGRAGLGVRRNDDVVVAEAEVVPYR